MQRIQKGKFIMKKAISVLMIAACMLCMVTACEKKDKKENDTSAAQATETDCTAAERVTTEPEGEITISEMIDQRIKAVSYTHLWDMLHRNSLVEWGRQTQEQIYIVWEPQCIILLRE